MSGLAGWHLLQKIFPLFCRDNSNALMTDKDRELESLRNEVIMLLMFLVYWEGKTSKSLILLIRGLFSGRQDSIAYVGLVHTGNALSYISRCDENRMCGGGSSLCWHRLPIAETLLDVIMLCHFLHRDLNVSLCPLCPPSDCAAAWGTRCGRDVALCRGDAGEGQGSASEQGPESGAAACWGANSRGRQNANRSDSQYNRETDGLSQCPVTHTQHLYISNLHSDSYSETIWCQINMHGH